MNMMDSAFYELTFVRYKPFKGTYTFWKCLNLYTSYIKQIGYLCLLDKTIQNETRENKKSRQFVCKGTRLNTTAIIA